MNLSTLIAGEDQANDLLVTGPKTYNGSTYDALDGARDVAAESVLASAARTASTASGTLTNRNSRGVLVFLKVTAASGTGGLRLFVTALDVDNGETYKLNATPSTAITATGRYGLMVYPGCGSAPASNATSAFVQATSGLALPRRFNVTVEHLDSSSYTYSASICLLP